MRITFLMELVLALAVGFGLARAHVGPLENPGDPDEFLGWVRSAVNDIVAGVGLVVGLGTWWEAFRRRSPHPWGPGRWVWSVAAAYLVLQAAQGVARFVAWEVGKQRWSRLGPVVSLSFKNSFAVGFSWLFGLFVAALAITFWIARPPPGPPADDRERAGRVFAALMVFIALASTAYDIWQMWRAGIGPIQL